ncbi:MAG: hypothetical protein Q9183_004973 [Haloplaca sp. 2 TL-2023]
MVLGSKFLTDVVIGKDTRHRLEDNHRWDVAKSRGISRDEFEMMAPFTKGNTGAVMFPRGPIPPRPDPFARHRHPFLGRKFHRGRLPPVCDCGAARRRLHDHRPGCALRRRDMMLGGGFHDPRLHDPRLHDPRLHDPRLHRPRFPPRRPPRRIRHDELFTDDEEDDFDSDDSDSDDESLGLVEDDLLDDDDGRYSYIRDRSRDRRRRDRHPHGMRRHGGGGFGPHLYDRFAGGGYGGMNPYMMGGGRSGYSDSYSDITW